MSDSVGLREPRSVPPPRRAWPVHLAVAAGSLLAGVALTVAALVLAGWRHVPVHRYDVTVVLEAGTTVERRDEIGRALTSAFPERDLRVRTKEELFESFRKEWEAENGELPASVTPADSQEQLSISTDGRSFDCALVTGIKASPEVVILNVNRVHGETGRTAALGCR